jgi:hypothetical protein
LCKEVKEGLLVMGVEEYNVDQQFTSGYLNAPLRDPPSGVVLKIQRGQIVGRVVGNGIDTATKRFWKEQLVALGDAGTMQTTDFETRKGMPWTTIRQSTSAPAGLFKDVNVTSYPKAI